MANDLVVSNASSRGLQIAVLENRRLVELQEDAGSGDFAVGDVYLGRVSRLLPGLNAAFVDIGYERDGFLHYLDLGPQVRTQLKHLNSLLSGGGDHTPIGELKAEPDIDKHGKITDVLKGGQTVLVQIMKEAISSKGPRLASQLSIPGQYLILMPFSSGVGVSRKFKSAQEKRALKKFLSGILAPNCGLIVRTAASGVDFEKLQAEYDQLMDRWKEMSLGVIGARPPKRVLSEVGRSNSVVRDLLSTGIDNIYVDDTAVHSELADYLEKHLPEKKRCLQLKQPRQGLFQSFGIERQIKGAFGQNVNLPNGAYLVIEHTEALHSIDINSGSMRMSETSPEDTALRINLDAATEIARQLRLRDMGGIIVIDFIDQKKMENRRAIHNRLKEEMAKDRAKHAILPMSKFGLMQVTRQRVRPELQIETQEDDPDGSGEKVRPAILLVDEVESNLEFLINRNNTKKLTIVCNPFLAAYLTKGLRSHQLKWFRKYGQWIRVQPNFAVPFMRVQYFSGEEEIKLD